MIHSMKNKTGGVRMVKIKQGSVFDEKCDLIILPCSSNGNMTSWVTKEIVQNNLPLPNFKIPFSSIEFFSTDNKYRKAYYVGYAASVKGLSFSSLEAIEIIINKVVQFSKEEKIGIVNLPILGTGAGKLDYNNVIEIYINKLESSLTVFNVYIPDKQIAKVFIEKYNKNLKNYEITHNPRVFISYSWGDNNVQKWVIELVNELCKNGVNARVDKYHLKPGFDLPQWMTDELIKAEKVLLVCDKFYAEKANMRKAGVGWETLIVQGEMLSQGLNNKYIAIQFGDFDTNIPIYMKSKLAISKEEIDEDIDNLLVHLFEIDVAPQIGEVPKRIKEKLKAKVNI